MFLKKKKKNSKKVFVKLFKEKIHLNADVFSLFYHELSSISKFMQHKKARKKGYIHNL